MKIVRFEYQQKIQYGFLNNHDIAVMDGDLFGERRETGVVIPRERVRLLAPVIPPSILCVGKNYKEHAAESKSDVPHSPLLFIKAASSICGPEDAVKLPLSLSEQVDFEAELAVIIGRNAYRVSKDDALSYVLGYTCAHDVSARNCQFSDGQWARGKSFDTFCPLGPHIETDLNVGDLQITGKLNGRVMQSARTSELIFDVPTLISYFSQGMTLKAGTVLLTGTPAGCGFARTPPVWLRGGDVYEVEIEGIGTLRNDFVNL